LNPANIHISNKLEKLISKQIEIKNESTESNENLGKWNATLFYSDRKKYLLILNAKTKYSIVIPEFKISDLNNIKNLLCENFYSQLIYEGILIDFKNLSKWIDNIDFCKTDNDSKTIGVQNYNIRKINDWKYEFPTLDTFDFREITKRLNSVPFKVLKWNTPSEEMKTLIDICA